MTIRIPSSIKWLITKFQHKQRELMVLEAEIKALKQQCDETRALIESLRVVAVVWIYTSLSDINENTDVFAFSYVSSFLSLPKRALDNHPKGQRTLFLWLHEALSDNL